MSWPWDGPPWVSDVSEWRFSAAAEADIARLLTVTGERFGDGARRRYEALLVTVLRDLGSDAYRNGSVPRPELGDGARSYHLRHSKMRTWAFGHLVRQPRHLLLYRILTPSLIGIARVLHARFCMPGFA